MLKFGIILAAVAVCYVHAANKYLLYTRSNPHKPVILTNTDSNFPVEFKLEDNTIILVHGHGGRNTDKFNTLITEDILKFHKSNVIVVDWENEASHSYSVAVSYVPHVANDLREFLRWLAAFALATTTTETPTTTTTETPTTTTTETPTTTTTETPTTTTTETPTTTTTETPTTTTETPTTTTTEIPTTTTTETPTTTTTETPTTTTTETPTTTTTETPTTTTTEIPTTTTTETPTTTTTETPTTTTTEGSIALMVELGELHNTPVLDLSKLHLVGFGLGAHIAGIASRQLRYSHGLVGRITGLDPSGSGWGSNSARLRNTDALYVEVIHTDGSGLLANGIGTRIGHRDFYANGGSSQPGCYSHSCSHNRAYELFAASMRNHLFGNGCNTMTQMNLNLCRGTRLNIGGTELSKRGYETIYRINTSRRYPF